MKSVTSRYVSGVALASIAASLALACGFDFPQTLLDQRTNVLQGMKPADWLSLQIQQLMPQPSDSQQASEGVDRMMVEQADVGDSHIAGLAAMRAARDGATAYAAGDGLPEAVRLYVAGAVEFQAAGTAGAGAAMRLAQAVSYFEKVLALPADQRALRATWASYMAGRALRLSTDPAAAARAAGYFQMTRELALQKLPDPLGLAVASYGEEGRLALDAGDVPHAIDLYLEQAARGSSSARGSLVMVAARLAQDPDLAHRYIRDPRVQKLWLAGVVGAGLNGSYVDSGAGTGQRNGWAERINKVLAGIDHASFSELDALAAIAYASGRFDLAASLATGVDAPLAAVVRAKLALRAGDPQAAAREFAAAISRHKSGNAGLPDNAWSRLLAENGVLAMSRGDYADALQSLLDAGRGYWFDAAYVAERVLTLDELTDFANRHVPASTVAGTPPLEPSRALRLLLARRQMREERFAAALENFRNNDVALDKTHPSLAAVASQYAAALKGSVKDWTGSGRAAAGFKAAALAKQFGMEILGYELAPDFAVLDGWTTLPSRTGADGYVSADETRRLARTTPPQLRFHYRAVAYALAQRAADNLPPRSQAFAAVLCANLRWAQASDNMPQARLLYARYVREAAYVPWSPQFGGRCEAPDFKGAAAFTWHTRLQAARVALRPYKILVLLLAAVLVVGGAVLLPRWRRRTLS